MRCDSAPCYNVALSFLLGQMGVIIPAQGPAQGLHVAGAQQTFIRPCLSPHVPFPRPRVRPELVPVFPVPEGGAHGFASGCFGERWLFSSKKPLNQSLGLRLLVPLLPPPPAHGRRPGEVDLPLSPSPRPVRLSVPCSTSRSRSGSSPRGRCGSTSCSCAAPWSTCTPAG